MVNLMLLENLPDSLYGLPDIEVVLKSRSSSIVFKSLSESLVNKRMYLSCSAVLLVMKGSQEILNYEGSSFIVEENEMVFLPKDLYVVSDFITDGGGFDAYVFFIDNSIFDKFLLMHPVEKSEEKLKNRILKIAVSEQIKSYLKSLDEVYKKSGSNHALLEVKILEFLLLLVIQEGTREFISSLISPVEKRSIKRFMEDNYLNNLKVSDYALLTGRSVSTFNRDFKRLYGITPKKWLISRRLHKSHELLCSTSLNVSEVSMEVGYENVSVVA